MKRHRSRTRRQRFVRNRMGPCRMYVTGNVVLVVKDGSIVTVLRKEWL